MLSMDGLERLVEPVLAQIGLVLHALELKREGRELVLRLVVDRQGTRGVDVEALTDANREVGAMLDLENPISERYRLIVESPGIERDLSTWRQIRYAVGEQVHLAVRGEEVSSHEGLLASVDDDTQTLHLKTAQGEMSVPWASIKSVRTVFAWATKTQNKRKF
ncbi:MAG: hypothetical protein FWC40_09590 [Proteobacteria bacterium]|nr:hypothetical protein [Pseudomonadota bacterium]